jgi:hypothetical protein
MSEFVLSYPKLFSQLTDETKKIVSTYIDNNCYGIENDPDWEILLISRNTDQDKIIGVYIIKHIAKNTILFKGCSVGYPQLQTRKYVTNLLSYLQRINPSINVLHNPIDNYIQIGEAEHRNYVLYLENIPESILSDMSHFLINNCAFDFPRELNDYQKGLVFYSEDIIGKLTAFQYIKYDYNRDIGEKYSSCTGIESRGKKIMSKLDKNVIMYLQLTFPQIKTIWAGLAFTKSDFVKEANRKIYANYGWDIKIDDKTPLGSKPGFKFMSFYWRPQSTLKITQDQIKCAKSKAKKLLDKYNNTLYISLDLIKEFFRIRDSSKINEVGGNLEEREDRSLYISNTLDIPINAPLLEETKSGYICRTEPFEINTILTFHTHPDGCYIINNANIGWPSFEDWMLVYNFINNTPKLYNSVHFVIAREGIYSMRLSNELVQILRYEDNYNKKIISNMKEQTTQFRNALYPKISSTYLWRKETTEQLSVVKKYINHVYSILIPGTKTPIFNIDFWERHQFTKDISFELY